ncbi:hypothetical protein K7W42_03815 [Deinococcus sp. HMF7604]|uniref:hypothetical protein n=1 Tax=Deinococcus betulae TaxID=2873312 RepID=UPI001CCD6B56|nr:hypothetical protein [Deinococcus betulae]MBZ9749986.1 hypothetical protein [Deinococcus betulae]
MKRTLAVLTVFSLLLAACRPQPVPTPIDPATVEPVAPVVGQALEVQQIPGTVESAAKQLNALLDPNNPDIDPDLKALLAVFGPGSAMPLDLKQPTQLGRSLVQNFAAHARGQLQVQGVTTLKQTLPTGTTTVDRTGRSTYQSTPADGYVIIFEAQNLRVDVKWKVGGAATVFVPAGMAYNPSTGQWSPAEQELPTNASATLTRGTQAAAGATFTMTPGECLSALGPTALSFNAWAGRAVNSPAALKLNYAWTDANISLSGDALYTTTKQKASLSAKLDVRGTTVNRCTPATFAFRPTRADLTASAEVPSHKLDLALYLRDLSNLEFSADALNAQNPLAKVGGTVNGRLSFNGRSLLTAFGPLADGADTNLQPGDQVKVKYVQDGKLVETDLPGALDGLGTLFLPY